MADEVRRQFSRRFAGLYAKTDRPSIAPKKLLRALLQVLLGPERAAAHGAAPELLHWFVGLSWRTGLGLTVFTKNRDRLLRGDVAGRSSRVYQKTFQRNAPRRRSPTIPGDPTVNLHGKSGATAPTPPITDGCAFRAARREPS